MQHTLLKIEQGWKSFNLERTLNNIGVPYTLPVQVALCGGAGFAIGFLFKRYFKFILAVMLAAVLVIKFFEYNSIITIDKYALRDFFGMQGVRNFHDLLLFLFNWVKQNIFLFIGSAVGFLFGCKLG